MNDMSIGEEVSSEMNVGGQLSELLSQAVDCLAALGGDYAGSAAELQLLLQRLAEGRFHLAVLGQFKRGKSTLLNALLGDDLLPTDILPVTAIPTFILGGDQVRATVIFSDQRDPVNCLPETGRSLGDLLAEYVTEAGNPHNQRQVERVEITHPAQLLGQGVVLIDTPGIGSTLKHNTEVAHQILPHCDAALFLVSPDPPITEMELEYLGKIQQQLPRTFFLLNKVDFLDDAEKVASLRFLSEQLTPFCAGEPQILPISARQGLRSRLAKEQSGWVSSGMQQVEENLIDFFARGKQQILQQALAGKSAKLVNDNIIQLQLSLAALTLPVAELEKRIEQFRQSLPAVERERKAAADVLSGDLKRAIEKLHAEVDRVREQAKQQISTRVAGILDSVEDPEEMERQVHRSLAGEIPQFFAPAMSAVTEAVRLEATELLSLNQQRSNQLIEQVRQTAANLFEIPHQAPSVGEARAELALAGWNTDLFISDMDPLGQRLARKLFTRKFRRRRTVKRLREESRKLVSQNVEQISWTLRRSLEENFRKFGIELDGQLKKNIAATRNAMEVALVQRENHSQQSVGEEVRLTQALKKLQGIDQKLGQIC